MTVQELIEALREFPQDIEVCIPGQFVENIVALEVRYLPDSNIVTII